MSNYTPMGFSGDDYDDEEPLQSLTAAQLAARDAARDAAWPEFAYEDLGNLSAVDPPYQRALQCDPCRVRWIGCQDAAECPRCDSDRLAEQWSSLFAADQIDRADVAAVLTDLRDALAKDKMYGAVGRVQAAMHQLGVQY